MLPSSPSADYISVCTFTALLRQSRFLLPAFPENGGARLRISGGCPARGEPEALIDLCSSIACRAQPCQRCSPVLQALIYLSVHFYGSASAEPFFCCPFPGELGSTTAHLRRLPRKGRAGGAQNLCSSIACRAQPCQRCSPVLQALIIFQCALLRLCFGRAVFCCPFPGEQGSTTAHLRRLPRKGRAGGAY